MKVYGYDVNTHLNDGDNSSISETLLDCVKVQSIPIHTYPVTLVYQNNQERQISLLTDREFSVPVVGQHWVFDVEGVIRFHWIQGEQKIQYSYMNEATDEIFIFWLYHVVIPIYLSTHQIYKFLHAGAVEIQDHAVLFMAPSHGGKSTLTAHFLKRGHPLITDDKMATFENNGKFYAVPAHPFHRPYRTVEVLGYRCTNPASEVRPIGAVYILKPIEGDMPCCIRKLKGIEKFSRLHEGGEMNFSFFTPQYVAYLASLANQIAVFEIEIPHDLNRLDEVHDILLAHYMDILYKK